MAGTFLGEAECPLAPLSGLRIAVLGYGNQGRAQALNLRDSGMEVWVAGDPDRPSLRCAAEDGFSTAGLDSVPSDADVLALLAPDELHEELLERLFGTPMSSMSGSEDARTRLLVVAHGFSLLYGRPTLPDGCDAVVVAPAGPGYQLRSRYEAGSGLPALLAVDRDPSGRARERARAYAGALGSARAGVWETSVREEVEVDLFGEQAVLCGGMNALLEHAFETLAGAGYDPEMAYLECAQQLRLTAELVERFGIEGMRGRISGTALYGDLTRGPRIAGTPTREAMETILREIRDGVFAREWVEALRRDPGVLQDLRTRARRAALEEAGRAVRRAFAKDVDST